MTVVIVKKYPKFPICCVLHFYHDNNSFIFIQIIEYIIMSINTQLYNVQLHIYICIHLGLPIARLQYFHNLLDIIPIEWN